MPLAATIAVITGSAGSGNIDVIDDDDDEDDDPETATTARITPRPPASPNGSLRSFRENYIIVAEIFLLSLSLLVLYVY